MSTASPTLDSPTVGRTPAVQAADRRRHGSGSPASPGPPGCASRSSPWSRWAPSSSASFRSPTGRAVEILIAVLLFFLLLTAAFVLPWERLPDWAWLVIPIGYMAVIALIRDAQGGGDSELLVVYLLPDRLDGPLRPTAPPPGRALLHGPGPRAPDPPRRAAQVPALDLAPGHRPGCVVTTLVASTISTMVHATASTSATWPARPPGQAQRGRCRQRPRPPRNPAAGRHRERHHGCRSGRNGDLLLGRGRADARLQRGRGGGHPLHRRLHRPGADRRTPPDHRRHAQGRSTRSIPRPWPKSPGPPGARTASSAAAWCGSAACSGRRLPGGTARPSTTPPTRHQPGVHSAASAPFPEDASAARATSWWPSTSPNARSWRPSGSALYSVQREVTQSLHSSRTTDCAS